MDAKPIFPRSSPTQAKMNPRFAENRSSFKELIDAVVNETIVELLGKNASNAFFKYLRDERGIPRDNVPQQLKTVFSTLQRLFGIAGRTIGRAIIRNLFKDLGLRFAENPSYDLTDYVEEALFDYVKEIILLSEGHRESSTSSVSCPGFGGAVSGFEPKSLVHHLP
ncbi:MAG: hypothetical protein ACLP5V_05815 [Candidatus Bathyarchaeia archaeon]